MHIIPMKGFPHQRLGYFQKGVVREVDDAEGLRLIRLGLASEAAAPVYATKVVQQAPVAGPHPGMADGEARPSSASPAAQASPQTTAKPSGRGGKNKKRGGE